MCLCMSILEDIRNKYEQKKSIFCALEVKYIHLLQLMTYERTRIFWFLQWWNGNLSISHPVQSYEWLKQAIISSVNIGIALTVTIAFLFWPEYSYDSVLKHPKVASCFHFPIKYIDAVFPDNNYSSAGMSISWRTRRWTCWTGLFGPLVSATLENRFNGAPFCPGRIPTSDFDP